MDELVALFLRTAYSIPDAHAKALASYIFRQVIEDVHVKYSISQQDMMAMNKAALPTLEELIVQHCVVNALKPMFYKGMYEHSYTSVYTCVYKHAMLAGT